MIPMNTEATRRDTMKTLIDSATTKFIGRNGQPGQALVLHAPDADFGIEHYTATGDLRVTQDTANNQGEAAVELALELGLFDDLSATLVVDCETSQFYTYITAETQEEAEMAFQTIATVLNVSILNGTITQ